MRVPVHARNLSSESEARAGTNSDATAQPRNDSLVGVLGREGY